jgi:predicted metal-dependent hydrolase
MIIPELCYLKIEGHSHNFWNFLHKFVPNYNEKIKWHELNSKYILQS